MSTQIEVLITIPFPEPLITSLRNVSTRLNFTLKKARKAEEITPDVWAKVEVLYTDKVLPSPEQAPKLRWIQLHYAGVEHAIDAPILQREGVTTTSLSGAASSQIAEYVLTMILSLGRRLPDLLSLQRKAEWLRERGERILPQELRGSVVGIVGYGSIGRQVANLLRPFGATILAAKRNAMQPEDTGYTPEGMGDPTGDFAHRIYPAEALRPMLKECDFVVVAAPMTPHTAGLIGPEELAAMKPTAFLIDISRGGVLDHTALIPALRDKRIAGAALDVFPEEPLPADNPLWKLSNVLITPHIAGATRHYDERAVALFAENLERYVGGLNLLNLVDLQRGY
jgi:phosphoglycerate dehydrogenase-like enzyme